MNENNHGHGAIKINPLHRIVWRFVSRQRIGKSSIPFNWQQGYDVRDTIGQIQIKNQGVSDSCGGQAGSYFIEVQRRLQKINEGAISAKSVYAPIAYPGGGTTVSALETQIAARGATLESTVPSYYPSGAPLDELQFEDRSWDTSAEVMPMQARAGYTPMDVTMDIDSIANAIQTYGAVLIEIDGQNNGTWQSAYPKPPENANNNPHWQHFMCLIGAKLINGVETLIALNSWGTEIGDNGVQYFLSDYVDYGFIDCFTFVKDSQLQPIKQNNSVWSWLWCYFMGKPLPLPSQ